jgi:hypothetical protein
MATLAELLRQGSDKLINLPSEAQRFITNPQAFTQLLTGKNPLPRETGFAAGATGLPAQEMSVLDPNQAPYMQGYSQGEPIGYAGIAAPFAAPAAVATAKALAPKAGMMAENYMVRQGMIQPLTAYHGTPHTIQGQFDINKVGTGEGAQAYGHGMYFAENPAVAKQYATDRSYVGKVMAGTPDNTPWDAQRIAQDTLNVHGDNAIAQLQSTLKANSQLKNPKQVEANKQIEDAIDILKTNQLQPTGNLYKVDIPDEYLPSMVNWDQQLKNQPEIIKTFIKKNIDDLTADMHKFKPDSQKDVIWDRLKGIDLMTWANEKYGKIKAAELLNSEGIKGIRYLDEGSRGTGKGTNNFVVFDPSTVKILEQNNKPVSRKELIEQQLNDLNSGN